MLELGTQDPRLVVLVGDISHGILQPFAKTCPDRYYNIGRNEPTTGEINYRNVFKHIHAEGFSGILGMEHGNFFPGKYGEMSLIKAYREVGAF